LPRPLYSGTTKKKIGGGETKVFLMNVVRALGVDVQCLQVAHYSASFGRLSDTNNVCVFGEIQKKCVCFMNVLRALGVDVESLHVALYMCLLRYIVEGKIIVSRWVF